MDKPLDFVLVAVTGAGEGSSIRPDEHGSHESGRCHAALARLADASATGFELVLVLVGKDGVERRSHTAAALVDFFDSVDVMPMRCAGMARNDGSC